MIGKEILNYTIISLIGKGGMGSVYLAENKFIKQQKVAVKVINGNMVNEFTRQKIAQEAQKLALMNHPNIVHFINYHIDDNGNVYLIMEYAEGYSLDNYIKNVTGLIVEEKLCPIFEPLLDAFEYAHKNKIIHKDIKPSNIIITPDGTPKVLDFGISALMDDKGNDEDSDLIMGTPSYMSPEQVKGQPLDQRSDIYSLGVLLHQMLTGNPPYDTSTMTEHEIYKHVVEDDLPRMKTYYKYVSDKVQTIVDKATSKNAKDRYNSCAEFKKVLHNAINPPKLSLGVKSAAVLAVAVVLVGVFFIWDYNRLKVYYYKDYVEKWCVPQGIGELSNSDKRHSYRMYRFEYQNYKLQRVSHVNSKDIVRTDGESERRERPLDIRFYYNTEDKLSRAKVLDQNGNVLYIKSYNEKLNTVVFLFNDEYGTEKTIGKQTIGYVDAFASDQDRGKISRYLLEYDKNGFVKTLRYAGFQNVLVSDADGIYGKEYVRDAKGRVIEEHYLAHDGSPKATKWGMGKKVFIYDENDNWVRANYQTIDGKPSLDAPDGTCICENVYDKYGNSIAQYFKNAEGNLALPAMYGVAGVKHEYDENGFISKQSYLGVEGSVEFSPKQGYAVCVSKCNKYGFLEHASFQDEKGNSILLNEGNASVRIVTDSKGNELERWNYDFNNELVANTEGTAGAIMEYDSLGHAVKIAFYDAKKELNNTEMGCAGWTNEYNTMGDLIKTSYFDTELRPTINKNNVSSVVYERDMRGNVTKTMFFDTDGNLTLNQEGLSIIEFKYDDNGNETERKFYNDKKKLTKGYIGYAQIKKYYDDKGHLLQYKFFDLDNKLTLVNSIAGTKYQRDDHGNIIEDFPIGTDGNLARGKLVTRFKYDDRDNVLEVSYFDGKGLPALNNLDYHKNTQKYNERNQSIEDRYYDTKGELTNYSTNNYCIARYEYDDKGQVVKFSCFDKNDKPTNYIGEIDGNYSIRTAQYDQYGRRVREFFYDKDGLPTDPKVMVPEAVCDYDKRGNQIYTASCDGRGKLINNPQTGWSYMRRAFDNQKNVLWTAYYNEEERPILCKDGYHKEMRTYTKSNKVETISYFNSSCRPMKLMGVHKLKYVYNENDQPLEESYWDEDGRAVNNDYTYHKIVLVYNKDNTPREQKFINVAGKVLLHQQLINNEWVEVKNWQRDVNRFADQLPYKMGEGDYSLSITSAKILNSNNVQFVVTMPKSKYEMSNAVIDNLKSFLNEFLKQRRKDLGIPSNVRVKGILKDGKGRIVSTSYK